MPTTSPTRIDLIHQLFNDLHECLGKYATRYGVDTDEVCELRKEIDAAHHDFTILESRRKKPYDKLTLRMLGDNITFLRGQWEDLYCSLKPDSELATRIKGMLSS